jgi:hypothetical protein
MSKLVAMSLLGCLLTAAIPVVAQEKADDHTAHHPATGASAAPNQKQADGPAQGMQNGLKRMQELMGKIQASKDPKEVELLLEEHMKLMREQMKSMSAMMSKGMMGGSGMKGEGPKEGGMMSGDMMKNHEAMMAHMQMMHGMMEQMMEHMAAEHHARASSSDKKK